jgi:preprotein translocase subunit SecE
VFSNIYKFYNQVKQEVVKITWPTKQELMTSVMLVVAVVLIFGLICLGVDYLINSVVQMLLKIGN